MIPLVHTMAAKCDFRRACTYCKTFGHEETLCSLKFRQEREALRRRREAEQAWHDKEHAAYLERVANRQAREAARQSAEAARADCRARTARRLAEFQAREEERKAAHTETARDKELNDAASESTAATLSSACDDADRAVRKLQKKLHEIDKLQQRADAGEHLDRLQVNKVEQRFAVQVALSQALAKADVLVQRVEE